jgi:hypothetical protein
MEIIWPEGPSLSAGERPAGVAVADVLGHETLELPFVKDDDVIEQVPVAGPDKAFGNSTVFLLLIRRQIANLASLRLFYRYVTS